MVNNVAYATMFLFLEVDAHAFKTLALVDNYVFPLFELSNIIPSINAFPIQMEFGDREE